MNKLTYLQCNYYLSNIIDNEIMNSPELQDEYLKVYHVVDSYLTKIFKKKPLK